MDNTTIETNSLNFIINIRISILRLSSEQRSYNALRSSRAPGRSFGTMYITTYTLTVNHGIYGFKQVSINRLIQKYHRFNISLEIHEMKRMN